MNANLKNEIRTILEKKMQGMPYIFRDDKSRQGMDGCTSSSMNSLEHRGEGPASIRVGRKVAYPVASYIDWVMSRITTQK
jgi:hypothetical protein